MSTADEAWDRFRSELEDLGRNLRGQADLEQLRRAGEAVMDSVGRVVQDPQVREGTRRAAQSLGDQYGLHLVTYWPSFGRYLYDLPTITVAPGISADTALNCFSNSCANALSTCSAIRRKTAKREAFHAGSPGRRPV